MRAVLLSFTLGVWGLQQQAALPGWGVWTLCCVAGLVLLWAARFHRGFVVAMACVIGFSYAALRVEWRLAPHLPLKHEQRDIALTEFVRGLPEAGDEGTRFLFEVESNGAGLRDFPRIVRLTWMPPARGGSGPLPTLDASQRWTLTARLKRPHSEANFGLRDMEVTMLERRIRATGYVSMSRAATFAG